MKRLLTVVCCMTLAAIPALGQKRAAEKGAMTDQQFVDFAAQTDMVEANLGQLAQNVSDNQQVKDYGQTLVSDHTQDYQQLSDMAKQASLNVPNAIDTEHNKMMIDPFQKLKDKGFDHKYVHEMIEGHTKAIAIYKKEAADAQSEQVKTYAQTALPVLEKHLLAAKDLEHSGMSGKMEK